MDISTIAKTCDFIINDVIGVYIDSTWIPVLHNNDNKMLYKGWEKFYRYDNKAEQTA